METPALRFVNRRSPVLSRNAAVACSQPLASEIGLSVLKNGGNAADACIAMAAALSGEVQGLNGSGRSPKALTLERVRKRLKEQWMEENGIRPETKNDEEQSETKRSGHGEDEDGFVLPDHLPMDDVDCITVPGAVRGWEDTLKRWGSQSMSELLEPAIKLATDGFPVGPVTADLWKSEAPKLRRGRYAAELLTDSLTAPHAGEIFSNQWLAHTLKQIADKGAQEGFYTGPTAEAIVDLVRNHGGCLSMEDLAEHESSFPDPIKVSYHGVDVWEMPPNGQGLTALLALNILEKLGTHSMEHNGVDYLHHVIESLRIAFADTRWFVADPDKSKIPLEELLSKPYAAQRRELVDPKKATVDVARGSPSMSSDTVSFCAVDQWGNACSFINSNYDGFGSGLIPRNCGFPLQNRGANFNLQPPEHPNLLAPGKRSYHTIIPGMATWQGELYCAFSVMGGFNQPQGHVQVLSNIIDHAMDAQTALDLPRICIQSGEAGGYVCVEDGIDPAVVEELRKRGHDVRVVKSWDRSVFGRGQIIYKAANGVLWGGSDGRGDGCAMGH